MTYEETINYLFTSAPLFQKVGALAYKPGLQTTITLDDHLGNPHKRYPVIHVAGTNGKGSTSSLIAAVLQAAGYKVGLYTSPHLTDFRERIRVNGEMIPKSRVIDFVETERPFFEPLHPSFFELTTALAFLYFAEQEVDVAVIEVGLGGRIDCTNIVHPILSIITNISFDHTQYLGSTIKDIASEKAGIIKDGVPIVIGEATEETAPIFQTIAEEKKSPIYFAEAASILSDCDATDEGILCTTKEWGRLRCELAGNYQINNVRTVLKALSLLNKRFHFSASAVANGFENVCKLTGLRGRWQVIGRNPLIVADAGHNTGGWEYISQQINKFTSGNVHILLGFSADKDIRHLLKLLPRNAHYYFTQANTNRALSSVELFRKAKAEQLNGNAYPNVMSAFQAARDAAKSADLIFVGGSCFIVADFLENMEASL